MSGGPEQDGAPLVPAEAAEPSTLAKLWQAGGARVLSIGVVGAVAAGAWAWDPAFLAPAWSNAALLFPILAVSGLCVYVGCPHKHMKLPSLDAMVIVGTASLAILDGLRSILSLWGATSDKASVLGSVILVAAGFKALQRGFVMADEQQGEPERGGPGNTGGSTSS